METYIESGTTYISHKDAMDFYDCTSVTLKNWREQGKIKCFELPLNSGRLYELNLSLRKSHIGGERFDR